jgi:hypothetical protein
MQEFESPAPASQSGLHSYLQEGLRNPRELGPIPRIGFGLRVQDPTAKGVISALCLRGLFLVSRFLMGRQAA